MNTIKPLPWEVWWADVVFEDNLEKSKIRPVLIVDDKSCIAFSLKITSHAPRNNEVWGEYKLLRWKYAGLTKSSTVRISKFLRLPHDRLIGKIGELHMIDIANIAKYLNSIYRV